MTTVPTPLFSMVRWREGYKAEEVDEFLAEVQRALAGRLPDHALAERISKAVFTPVRLRPGYDMQQVDDHLDELHLLASQGHPRS